MKCITELNVVSLWWRYGAILQIAACLALIALAVGGIPLESGGGWIAIPPQPIRGEPGWEPKQRTGQGFAWRAGWDWMRQSWSVAALRSVLILLLLFLTDWWEWHWLCLLPWAEWAGEGLAVAWPALGRQPGYRMYLRLGETARRWMLVGLLLLTLVDLVLGIVPTEAGQWMVMGVGAGSVTQAPQVNVSEDSQGIYQVTLRGEFRLQVNGKVEFYKRILIIFLYLLEGDRRGSRWTRDGRTPLVRQEQLADWFGVPHPSVSRWTKYWLTQDWRRLLSRRQGEPLTLEVQQRIIDCWVQFPWWSAERLWQHLRGQGEKILLSQVQQAAHESGWSALKARLGQVYAVTQESIRPRDEWLVSQLLAQVKQLVARLEASDGVTSEQQLALADLQALSADLGLQPAPESKPFPWVLQVEQILFGHWEPVETGTVRCLYCGSTDISRKSRQPRLKQYLDAAGQLQSVEVYRYYCHNPDCRHRSFTDLPPDLLPYSRQRLSRRLATLQLYLWGRSVYRRSGEALGVGKMTTYRWVSGFGYGLLPVAALFGIVRSSGVVGIDEKFVLVPKNNKPQSKMKRWMYVYFAVDAYTYDLLHLDIYPYNDARSAQAFLLALRSKGYRPRVVVTDMRVDYGDLIAQVFPNAIHHECLFHALQQLRVHLRESYGLSYADNYPDVVALRDEIDHIFAARTKRTAQRRFEAVLAQREHFVSQKAAAASVFDFLERHWPRWINAIESQLVPTTNNATEQVIRIFNQHYKTFCGFESIESARRYLAVFEKVYRFTPFSNDARPSIRGRSPLELAGYEVAKLPMAQLCRAWALHWPNAAFEELVPYV